MTTLRQARMGNYEKFILFENLVLWARRRSRHTGVRDRWLYLGVLCLKSQIPSTKLQINHKFQIPKRFKAIVFLFGILNFGHWYLFEFWDLLFEISIRQ